MDKIYNELNSLTGANYDKNDLNELFEGIAYVFELKKESLFKNKTLVKEAKRITDYIGTSDKKRAEIIFGLRTNPRALKILIECCCKRNWQNNKDIHKASNLDLVLHLLNNGCEICDGLPNKDNRFRTIQTNINNAPPQPPVSSSTAGPKPPQPPASSSTAGPPFPPSGPGSFTVAIPRS